MSILLLSCSLKPTSHSRVMARQAQAYLQSKEVATSWLDLQDEDLPFCDGGSAYAHRRVEPLKQMIAGAKAVIMAVPIYNFDINAAAKNLVELTGRDAWTDQIVGFICAAGGHSSYASVMGLAGDLMLDFRTLVVPRFVYATGEAFKDGQVVDEKIQGRIEELCDETLRLANALR